MAGRSGIGWHARLGPLTRERPRPAGVRELRQAPWLAVVSVCFGAFMGQLDASIVTVAFPEMSRSLHAPVAAVQWVALAYMVTLVALLAAVGRVSDAAGRKLIYVYGFAVFTAASAGCGLAPGLGWLVAARVVQAVGAAMLQANSIALITTTVAGRDRVRALGVQASAQALGLALGPSLGGLLVAASGWRMVFLVNVPVGVVALVAGQYLLPRSRERHPITAFDWAGVVLLAAAVVAVLAALSGFSGLGLDAAAAAGLLGCGAALGAGFVLREGRAVSPLVEVALLRSRPLLAGLGAAFAGYLVLFALLFAVPLVLDARGVPAAVTGLALTALPAGFAVAAVGSSLLPGRLPATARGVAGLGSAAAALLAAAAVPGLPPAGLAGVLLACGLGLGLFTPANNAAVMGAAPASRSGVLGGLLNMSRGLGTALGVAAITLILHLAAGAHDQLRPVALVLAAAAACGAVLSIRRPASGAGRSRRGLR